MADETEWTRFYAAKELHKEGDFAEAIAEYEAALQLAGESKGSGFFREAAYLDLGLAYRAQGEVGRALETYEALAKLLAGPMPIQSRLFNLYYYRGCAWAASENIEAARADHTQLRDWLLEPGTAKDFTPEHVHPSSLDLAIADCDQAGDLFGRGLAKRAKKDGRGASADFRVAYEAAPQDAALRQWWLTSLVLWRGLPNPYLPESLYPGVEYVSIEYNEPSEIVQVLFFGQDIKRHSTNYSREIGRQIHEEYKQSDAWIFLHYRNHEEGRVYYYWRPTPAFRSEIVAPEAGVEVG